MSKKIITISREFGSGGRIIGEMLAKELGISFYDKEILDMASEKSGYTKEVFENSEKQMTNSLLFSIAMGSYARSGLIPPVNTSITDNAYYIQSDIIRELAKNESCVIVGRCADFILRDTPGCTNVFIFADIESRRKRAIKDYGMSAEGIDKEILKIDKARANHYNYYTDQKWGEAKNYHLSVDSGGMELKTVVGIIKMYLQ